MDKPFGTMRANDRPQPDSPYTEGIDTCYEIDLLSLTDSMENGFAVFDADDRLTYHNPHFLRLFPFLERLGDLKGLTFYALASMPGGEVRWSDDADAFINERLRAHARADGEPFIIPREDGGWIQVRERRTPEGWTVSIWSDVTSLKAAETGLRDMIDALPEGVIRLDAEANIVMTNTALRRIFGSCGIVPETGQSLPALLETAHERGLFAPGMEAEALGVILRKLVHGSEPRIEIPLSDGEWLLASHHTTPDGGSTGIWTRITTQKRREADLIEMREQLRHQTETLAQFAHLVAQQARNDMLTGLPNRFALEERLGEILHQRDDYNIWLALVDIDQFKRVNDTVGHEEADELLRELGRFLRLQLRSDDMLARIGSDEFAMLLTDLEEPEVMSIANRINAATHNHLFIIGQRHISLEISIGLVRAKDSIHMPSSLLAAADTACRVAKEAGGDRVQLFDLGDPKVNTTQQRLGWGERIRRGLELNHFTLHLQAIVDGSRKVLGYEALIRMRDENNVSFSPAQFLPAARRLGLMSRIDSWVCRQCIDYARRLIELGLGQYISVNFGVHSLANTAFQKRLLDLVDANPGIEKALRIEITETDELYDTSQLALFLDQVRQRGIHVYLDDFGNGYNSFEALKQLPVDGIKIDWTVTRDLLDDPIDEAQIKAAVSIARSLGLELVIEGVEEEKQLSRLRELGAGYFQGFFFHRPAEAETVFS